MKKLIRNWIGLSPIFATLILIAIAIIAGIVVYTFTSGNVAAMTNGEIGGRERVTVHGFTLVVDANGAAESLIVYAQTTCSADVTIDAILIKDSAGNPVGIIDDLAATLSPTGKLTTISPSDISELTGQYKAGNYYTVILTSTTGYSFPSAIAQAH